MSLLDEQFFIDNSNSANSGLTSVSKINTMVKKVSQVRQNIFLVSTCMSQFLTDNIYSQMLLNYYVKLQGGVLSQMLRKSVETRDWLNTVEPRTVRAVMKRVVEETTMIDRQVGRLYEEGMRKARSSDSSRRTRLSQSQSRHARSTWSVTNSQLDTSLASNIQKMFNERIEIFSPVEFSKVEPHRLFFFCSLFFATEA